MHIVHPHCAPALLYSYTKRKSTILRDSTIMAPNAEADATGPVPTRVRQRPGAACDECRRRKLRCDGQQPQCGVCQETGVVCEVTQRGVRGPKKGHLKALKNRVVHLEAMLETFLPRQDLQATLQTHDELTPSLSTLDVADSAAADTTESWRPRVTASSALESRLPLTEILQAEL